MEKGKAKLLRVYISNTDKLEHKPLYGQIVYLAKREGLSGATILKGIMGFGSSSVISSINLWEISEKLPLVVEVVDTPEKIERFSQSLIQMLDSAGKGCLVTIQDLEVLHSVTGSR